MRAGVTRFWDYDGGWGVVDSDANSGGCWVHFSAVHREGYRYLTEGEPVRFEFVAAAVREYKYRAVAVYPC